MIMTKLPMDLSEHNNTERKAQLEKTSQRLILAEQSGFTEQSREEILAEFKQAAKQNGIL